MSRHDKKKHRSPFAESAYAHAESADRSLASRGRRQQEGGRIHQGQVSVPVHAEFQPLAGASVVIITNTSKNDKVADACTLELMEERESIGCAVESLGGRWVPTLEDGDGDITHAIWISSDEGNQRRRPLFTFQKQKQPFISNEASVKLNSCLSLDIPVVSPKWLVKIRELSPGQHWSEINVDEYIPKAIESFHGLNDGGCQSSNPTGINHNTGSRRDAAASLSASIGETYKTLIEENPDLMEKEALQRAMELSMLDFAIVHHTSSPLRNNIKRSHKNESPHQILQVPEDASPSELKKAYRRRALETHPDKGGKSGEFEAVARAYTILLNATNSNDGIAGSFVQAGRETPLKSTAHWDSELKEHRNLVRELYQHHGQDMDGNLQRQNFALERLGLCHRDAGSQTRNEKDQLIRNSCFYLSLASSYLSGVRALEVWDKSGRETQVGDAEETLLREADDALINQTALHLKRVIEAAVLTAHPEWAAKGLVGEEVQAFSDFLVYILESQTMISDWSVVVFDTSSGFVDIYKGQGYKDEGGGDRTSAAANTLALRFVPGHYQPLLSLDSARPTLAEIISVLDECGVLYVVTDGASP